MTIRILFGNALFFALAAGAFADEAPEVINAKPREIVAMPLEIETIRGGYQMKLNRAMADGLLTGMKQVDGGEEALAKRISGMADRTISKENKAKLELLSYGIAVQSPEFKKSLEKNMGKNGVVIQVYGLENKLLTVPLSERPFLKGIFEKVVPEIAQDETKKLLKMARTMPMYWKIQPIND